LLTLLAAIAIYDMFALRKVHKATIIAAALAIGLRVLSGMASSTEFGTAFVRSLGYAP
jgi:hypothetical protein